MPESIFSNIAHVYPVTLLRFAIVELITQKKCIVVSGSILQEHSLKWI